MAEPEAPTAIRKKVSEQKATQVNPFNKLQG
jgi:hypothetical protein